MNAAEFIPRPPESVDDRHDAQKQSDATDQIEAFVATHATTERVARVSPNIEVIARIGVPFRVEAYRHDADEDVIEEYGIEADRLRFDFTDGWVGLDGDFDAIRTIPYARIHSETARMVEDIEQSHPKRNAVDVIEDIATDSMVRTIYEALREGVASVPLTTDVYVEEDVEPEPPHTVEEADAIEDDRMNVRTKTVTVGTARYRVGGIYPTEVIER